MPILVLLCLLATFSFAVDQEQATPYDLIRPVWPLVWDTASVENGGTVESFSKFVPNPSKRKPVPQVGTVPQDFIPNGFVPDTLNQAFLDARNLKIGRIRVNQAGYLPDDNEKQFYYVSTDKNCGDSYSVVNLAGTEVAKGGTFVSSGKTTKSSWKIVAATDAASNNQNRYSTSTTGPEGTVCIGNLSTMSLPENERLRIKVGKEYSATFIISDRVYSMVRDATIKFYGINRSGNSESWFHKPSHTKDGAGKFVQGDGTASGFLSKEGALQGGWYDCGDHLKESQTQSYAFMVLAVMAASNPSRDDDNYNYNHGETVNTDGIPDILREAKHGADFFLRSYNFANGIIDNMVVSVGNFGADHGWWGRPENQDALPATVTGRGGPHERDLRLGELGSNISGQIAAGLAILSKNYATYDKPFADSCLVVAKKMYDFAKNLKLKEKGLGSGTYDGGKEYKYNTVADGWSSAAYNGNNESHDDLAIAAIALHYATYPDSGMLYLNEAVEESSFASAQEPGPGFFRGGWFAWSRDGMRKAGKNTSWANAYTYTLYGFYKLLLKDEATATSYGISETDRLWYAENVAYLLAENLSNMSASGSSSILIPGRNNAFSISYGDLWYNMTTDQTWIYNRYQAGNIFEVFAYADVTKDLEGVRLPQKGVQNWNSSAMKQLGINQLNYMLGINPWDVSFLLGVGDKNDAHPHHRAANPEGKNMPGAAYVYNPPVGALFGGVTPSATEDNAWSPSTRSWEDYHLSETCIDATAMFLAAGSIATKEEDKTKAPSEINVEIRYVGYDSAIVNITQDMRGQAMILYSDKEAGPFTEVALDSNKSVKHTIHLKNLSNGTTYYFKVVAINSLSEKYSTKWLVDSTYTPYHFTTLASAAPSADIQNVKVCNLSADSAEIMWYTPNGSYESKIYYDTVLTSYDKMAFNTGDTNADVSGIPTQFHYVKIGGLKEKTTYYYVVESNGVRRSVDDKGQPLKFTTPVTQYDFEIRAYQYEFTGLDFLDLNLMNKEERAFDSLTLRLYVTARPEQIQPVPGVNNQPGSCPLMIDVDICQAYDEAGFNKPCENDREIRDLLRGSQPVKLEDTYDASTGTYDWYFPVPLGSTTIKSSSRMRIDLGFSYGIYQNGACETLRSTASKRMNANSGDWSWAPHKEGNSSAERVDYEGMPILDKDFGDQDLAPVNPYIVVYRKDEFVWGYSPSYSEMTTKKANYEMTVTLDAPFNVTSGSYIQIDSVKSTMHVKGTALITEGGYVTAIWVNGVALSKEDLKTAAIYNSETKKYDLNIPVKLAIGTNKVDVTIFAGPDPECDACQENGGCAFVNRNYYIQFSKGDRTAGILTLLTEDGNSVSSPAATDGSTKFYVVVKDKDNKSNESVSARLVNSRTKDTVVIELAAVNKNGEFKSELLTAVDDKSASYPKISFFGGDTITVIYVDAEDEEDISMQSFYANPTHPVPQEAVIADSDCNGVGDIITATFSGSTFGNGITLDSAVFAFDSTATKAAYQLTSIPKSVEGMTATFRIAESDMPETAAPSGFVTFYMTEKGTVTSEKIALTDGINPTLLSVTILENEDPRKAQDTLKIAFSEPVVLPSQTVWPLRVTDGTKEIDQSSIVVKNVSTTDNGKSYLYVIEGNTNGTVVQGKNDNKKGYLAEILESFKIADIAMNPLSDCAGPKTIMESVRPVPVSYANMIDKTGDGQPDELYIAFESIVDKKHMLDSFEVYWGNPEVYHSFNNVSDWKIDTIAGEKIIKPVLEKTDSSLQIKEIVYDSIIGTKEICAVYDSVELIDSSKTPPEYYKEVKKDSITGLPICVSMKTQNETIKVTKFDTSYTYTLDTARWDTTQTNYTAIRISVPKGVYLNKTNGSKNGRGTVLPRKGEIGGFFDKTYAVNDKCPPIAIAAVFSSRETSNGQIDLLEVQMSESLDSVPSHQYYIERKRNGSSGVFLDPRTIMNGENLKKVTYLYSDDASDAIWFGDSIRLVSDTSTGFYKDMAGNYPGKETPWVPVTGVIEKVKFKVKMLAAVTKKDKDEVVYAGETLPPEEQFRLTIVHDDGETLIASGKDKLEKVTAKTYKEYNHGGPTFKIDVTMPEVLDKTEIGEYKRDYTIEFSLAIYNNLGVFTNEVEYRFDLADYIEYVSANNVLTLNLEWCANEDAPRSIDNRKVGSGAYIANFDFKAKALYVATKPDENDNKRPIKGSSSKTMTFGVRR